MRLSAKYFLAIFLMAITMVGCQRGEDDPVVSLRTRQNRVIGEWQINRAQIVVDDTTFSLENGEIITTINGQELPPYDANWTYVFEETGQYTLTKVEVYPEDWNNSGQVSYEVTETEIGSWNFTAGVGETPNKSQLLFLPERITSQLSFAGAGVEATSIEGQNQGYLYNIRELRNDKIVFEVNREVNDPQGQSVYTLTMELGPQ